MAGIEKKSGVIAWALYDWANSSFSSVITTFVFATYFTQSIAKSPILGTAQWGDTLAIAGIMIAIFSPIFGAIADYGGRRKLWLGIFTAITVVCTALLWFAKPAPQYALWALSCVAVGTIGLEIAQVFYNAMMYYLAPKSHWGRLSGWAWGLGYLGGICSLLIVLYGFIEAAAAWGFNVQEAQQIRITGPLIAVWLAVFSIPLFLFTPDVLTAPTHYRTAVRKGLQSLIATLKSLKEHANVFRFLLARMLYIDGLNTIFAFGGIYAAGTFGLSFTEVIQFGIAMNVSAGIGAILLAWVDDLLGAKFTILLSLFGLISTGAALLLIHSKLLFWIFALILGLFVGPTQSASRSFMTRLVPPERMNEMFGLYAFSGRVTSFLGPWLLGWVTLQANSQRAGLSTAFLLIVLGAIFLFFVRNHNSTQA